MHARGAVASSTPSSEVAGGDKGGRIVATGTPEDVAATPESYTGQYLKPILKKSPKVAQPEREDAPRKAKPRVKSAAAAVAPKETKKKKSRK